MTANVHEHPLGVVIFLHIPKAAGSTMNTVLGRQYEEGVTFTVNGSDVQGSWARLISLPAADKASIRLLRGHMDYGWHELFVRPSTYFTVLREPVDRVISMYYYILRSPKHYAYGAIQSRRMSLHDFVTSGVSLEVDNGQTRLLSGMDELVQQPFADSGIAFGECSAVMVTQAKEHLRDHFPIFGLAERFDETLLLLKRSLGWTNLYYARENVSRDRPPREEIPTRTLETIREYNKFDIELYHYARALFEDLIAQQSLSFALELGLFRLANGVYPYIDSRRRVSQERLEAGFAAYAAGDLASARRGLLAAIWKKPSVLRNLGVLSVLLESWLGSERVNAYRAWRHRNVE